MRVIAGYLGGRNFDSTAKITHPMSEKMRGAIFNSIGDINDLSVLDVFSGSGALSIEAISRGAKTAIAVESNKHAQNDIKKNISKLGIESKVKIIKSNFASWLQTQVELFDIIIVDPPYRDLQLNKILNLERVLKNGGILILSLPPTSVLPVFVNLTRLIKKNYGDSTLVFYKNNL